MGAVSDSPQVVLAMYRPRAGQDAALLALIARHVPTLREQGLATSFPATLLRASDGTYVEIFEWAPGGDHAAHSNPAVLEIWGAMEKACAFVAPADLPEAKRPFHHFVRVEGVTA